MITKNDLTDFEQDIYEACAATREYSSIPGKITRAEAERGALQDIERRRQLIEPQEFYEGEGGKER